MNTGMIDLLILFPLMLTMKLKIAPLHFPRTPAAFIRMRAVNPKNELSRMRSEHASTIGFPNAKKSNSGWSTASRLSKYPFPFSPVTSL
jgi:hypothetical protein